MCCVTFEKLVTGWLCVTCARTLARLSGYVGRTGIVQPVADTLGHAVTSHVPGEVGEGGVGEQEVPEVDGVWVLVQRL